LTATTKAVELLRPTIEEAIRKETNTISNEITHDIKLHIDKIKKSDSLNITISQDPENNQRPDNSIETTKEESKKKKKKFLFFKRKNQ
ncbi:MAG: hypothetical protein HRT68_13260, partial [Flavobacteriaceae bacterium]|nr:hypothetical protein [Flavobacteriaceae bacterium]